MSSKCLRHSSHEAFVYAEDVGPLESLCMSNEIVVDVIWLHVPGISGEGSVQETRLQWMGVMWCFNQLKHSSRQANASFLQFTKLLKSVSPMCLTGASFLLQTLSYFSF